MRRRRGAARARIVLATLALAFSRAAARGRQRFVGRAAAAARAAERPVVYAVEPTRVHVSGGAALEIRVRRARERVSCAFFGGANGREALASGTRAEANDAAVVRCVAPSFVSWGGDARFITQVFVANADVGSFEWSLASGERGAWTPTDGNTYAAIEVDGSAPGCFGCYDSSDAIGSRSRESWHVSSGETTGPEDGGTTFRVRASSLASGSRGTFYPGSNLVCGMFCNKTGGGWETGITSATWIAYDEVECVSPPWPGSGASGTVATTCIARVSNDGGATFDDLIVSGGDGDGTQTPMSNAVKIDFTYDVTGTPPLVTSVTSTRTPETSPYGARGPFIGGTELVIRGSNFLSSSNLACKFTMPANAYVVVSATYVSSTEIRCVTPEHEPATGVEFEDINYATGAPCFESFVHVSNQKDRAASWSATNSANSAKFFYCDLFVSASGSRNGDGSSKRPFLTIQDAIDAALRREDDASTFNRDVVRLESATHGGERNAGIVTPSRGIAVRIDAGARGATIDCEDTFPLFAPVGDANGGVRFSSRVDFVNCDFGSERFLIERCDAFVAADGSSLGASCSFAA